MRAPAFAPLPFGSAVARVVDVRAASRTIDAAANLVAGVALPETGTHFRHPFACRMGLAVVALLTPVIDDRTRVILSRFALRIFGSRRRQRSTN